MTIGKVQYQRRVCSVIVSWSQIWSWKTGHEEEGRGFHVAALVVHLSFSRHLHLIDILSQNFVVPSTPETWFLWMVVVRSKLNLSQLNHRMAWSLNSSNLSSLGVTVFSFLIFLSFALSSEGYTRRPGGRRHNKGNPESSLMWRPQEQVVTEMISEEGGKGLRRPHCTVEEVSPFSVISLK